MQPEKQNGFKQIYAKMKVFKINRASSSDSNIKTTRKKYEP